MAEALAAMAVRGSVSDHRPGPSVLRDWGEASRLAKATRRIVLGGAETHGAVALSNAGLDEVDEEPPSDPSCRREAMTAIDSSATSSATKP